MGKRNSTRHKKSISRKNRSRLRTRSRKTKRYLGGAQMYGRRERRAQRRTLAYEPQTQSPNPSLTQTPNKEAELVGGESAVDTTFATPFYSNASMARPPGAAQVAHQIQAERAERLGNKTDARRHLASARANSGDYALAQQQARDIYMTLKKDALSPISSKPPQTIDHEIPTITYHGGDDTPSSQQHGGDDDETSNIPENIMTILEDYESKVDGFIDTINLLEKYYKEALSEKHELKEELDTCRVKTSEAQKDIIDEMTAANIFLRSRCMRGEMAAEGADRIIADYEQKLDTAKEKEMTLILAKSRLLRENLDAEGQNQKYIDELARLGNILSVNNISEIPKFVVTPDGGSHRFRRTESLLERPRRSPVTPRGLFSTPGPEGPD
jgi:FtsZ-binding cell division protein ZapB